MVNEEAISELQKAIDLIKQNGKDWLDERDIPILQMAIAALELSDSIMQQLDCKMFHSGVDVESTISEATPSVQFAKDTNVPNNDTISRQDTIDIILSIARGESDVRTVVDNAVNSIKKMPSAQPDAPDTNVGDMISRQAVVDALDEYFDRIGKLKRRGLTKEERAISLDVVGTIRTLPSAQPEIIYCKDCACGHCEVWLCGDGSTDVYGYCGRTNFRVLPYDYCSRPERRENG